MPSLHVRLRSSRSKCVSFLRDLAQLGLMGVGRHSLAAFVTPFFARKKGDKQRLVWDCRNANASCRPLPAMSSGLLRATETTALINVKLPRAHLP